MNCYTYSIDKKADNEFLIKVKDRKPMSMAEKVEELTGSTRSVFSLLRNPYHLPISKTIYV